MPKLQRTTYISLAIKGPAAWEEQTPKKKKKKFVVLRIAQGYELKRVLEFSLTGSRTPISRELVQ
jgi:hypothetical protein